MIRWETATERQHRWKRWGFAVGVALALASRLAEASTAEERAIADALFREAKALIAKKQYPEACRKLEESQRLDRRDGTLLNLAVCHEQEGKIATAWVEFQEALAAARRAKRWDRINLATGRLKALQGKVPKLTIDVSPGAAAEGFELRCNGLVIGRPVWGTAVPVDPGSHTLEATAPGMIPWEQSLDIEVGEDRTVLVPVLKEKPKPPPPTPNPKPTPEPKPPPPEPDHATAYVVGGLGVLAMGVGTFYGLRAMNKSSEGEEHCRGTLCDQRGLDLNDDADRAATVSNIAFGIGILGVGMGTYMLLTSGNQKADETSTTAAKVDVTPLARRDQAAVVLSGRW